MKTKKLIFALFALLLPGCVLFLAPPAGTTVSASNTLGTSALTAGTVDELLKIVQDPGRTSTRVEITADLIIDSYIDLQQNATSLSLELGQHSITVKNGGWLVLYVKELKGTGTDAPLIKVETGGSLVLGANTNNSLGINGMKLIAEGGADRGGTAVELAAQAYFSTVNHPAISAYGNGARAVFHASAEPFSLPAGLTLYAQGNGAAALETGGNVDIFYASVRAEGDGAAAVRIPAGAAAAADSALVAPMPAGMTTSASTFVDFNDDMDTPITLWQGKSSGLYLANVPRLATVARGGDMNKLEAIWVDCTWDAAGVDFTQIGTYPARGHFSPLFPVTVTGLPVEKDVTVSIKDGNGKPDISTVHPLMPSSIGGGEVSYGFYIICNASYTRDIAQLWCSEDNGKSWVSADTMFQVFMQDKFRIPSDQTIYVTGLKPEKSYLFRLESTGRDTMDGEYAMAGISDVRKITIQKSGKVANIDWSGDRDGGDSTGNPPADVIQPAPSPPASGATDDDDTEDNAATTKDAAVTANNYQPGTRQNEADSSGASAPEADPINPVKEYFGSTYSVITGLRLRMMVEDNKAAVFSKQGVTITIPAVTIRALAVNDEDMIFIRIKRGGRQEFSFSILINNIAVKKLDNSTVRLPYTPSGKSTKLTLEDEKGNHLTYGSFDTAAKIAEFTVNAPGHFTIQESGSSAAPDGSADRPSGLKLALAVLGAAALIGAGWMLFIYKRRRCQ